MSVNRRNFLKLLGWAPVAGAAAYFGISLTKGWEQDPFRCGYHRGHQFVAHRDVQRLLGEKMGAAMARRKDEELWELVMRQDYGYFERDDSWV